VNPDHFDIGARHPRRAPEDCFTVGFVGSLKPWHGVEQLIQAYEQLCHSGFALRLVIAGDGPDRERLESLVRALPKHVVESIEFLGMVPHPAIPCLLATLDAAVAPGVLSDTYFSPLKIFEYMAAGLPIVAARQGQTASLIEHGTTGLLYNPGDTADLARALFELRANPVQSVRMGENARQSVLAHHTWDQRCDAIMEIVERSNVAGTLRVP
jgi:glycosyltransferase involved in cell wall biosynthesis